MAERLYGYAQAEAHALSAPTVSQVLPGSTTAGHISPCLRHRSLLVALGLQKMAHCITTARPREGPHSAVLSDILWANEKHQETKLNTKENIYCLATAGHYEKGNIHLPQAAKCHPLLRWRYVGVIYLQVHIPMSTPPVCP